MAQFRFCVLSLFLSTCVVFSSGDAIAQGATRYPMLELFTNTLCSICASQDPGFFNRLKDYEGQYHLVSFYPGTPYPSCIFYQANTSENKARKDFYPQVFGTPDVALNGVEFRSPASVSTAVLDGLTDDTSWLSVVVSETSGSTRDVTITLENYAGSIPDTGMLFAVIVEREIMYNAPNGINLHHNVFRKFLTPVDGEAVDLSSDLAIRTFQYALEAEWQTEEVFVVAWFMDPETKEVFNSGTRFDPLVSVTRNAIQAIPLQVYPNPASDYVSIQFPGNAEGILNVFDASGRRVAQQVVHSDTHTQLSVANWSIGSYYAEVLLADGLARGRFEVVR